MDPCRQRTTHAHGARPSTNLASSQKSSRTGSRQRQARRDPVLCGRGRKGQMGKDDMGAQENQKRRKQHSARCLPLRKRNNPNDRNSSSSSTRSNAVTMILSPETAAMSSCLWPKWPHLSSSFASRQSSATLAMKKFMVRYLVYRSDAVPTDVSAGGAQTRMKFNNHVSTGLCLGTPCFGGFGVSLSGIIPYSGFQPCGFDAVVSPKWIASFRPTSA